MDSEDDLLTTQAACESVVDLGPGVAVIRRLAPGNDAVANHEVHTLLGTDGGQFALQQLGVRMICSQTPGLQDHNEEDEGRDSGQEAFVARRTGWVCETPGVSPSRRVTSGRFVWVRQG